MKSAVRLKGNSISFQVHQDLSIVLYNLISSAKISFIRYFPCIFGKYTCTIAVLREIYLILKPSLILQTKQMRQIHVIYTRIKCS